MVGRRNYLSPEGWVLGVSSEFQEPHVFMNDQGDPDASRGTTDSSSYTQMGLGGVRGISLSNPLVIETIQYVQHGGIDPAPGDMLYANTAGKLSVAQLAGNGAIVVANQVIIGIVHKGPYKVGTTTYIAWAPIAAKLVSEAGGTGPQF